MANESDKQELRRFGLIPIYVACGILLIVFLSIILDSTLRQIIERRQMREFLQFQGRSKSAPSPSTPLRKDAKHSSGCVNGSSSSMTIVAGTSDSYGALD